MFCSCAQCCAIMGLPHLTTPSNYWSEWEQVLREPQCGWHHAAPCSGEEQLTDLVSHAKVGIKKKIISCHSKVYSHKPLLNLLVQWASMN